MRSKALGWGIRGLGVALLLTLVAGDAVLPGTWLSRRDIFRLHLPLREFVARQFAQGHFPTWNDLDGLGASVPGTAVSIRPARTLGSVPGVAPTST